jgi:sortase A
MTATRWRALPALALLCAGGALCGERIALAGKAQVARHLIDRAFAAHLEDGAAHRPWRWADTWPIARLDVPRLGVRRVILAGATGATLAFGPGHVDGTALPGTPGNVVLAGHRDSWFAFLADLRPGDELLLHSRAGVERYTVERLEVRDAHDAVVLLPAAAPRLTLVTCWPFDGFGALVPGTRRYVVTCLRTGSDHAISHQDRGRVS